MAYWGLESVGLAGSEYRCEERGVTKACVSARVSASIQKWILAGDLDLRGTDVVCK